MTIVYRGMNREQLDAGYDNTKAIPNFPEVYADMKARSAALYGRHESARDLAYGDAPRERYDWFSADVADAPTLLFIHGGYWQACEKTDFAFVAEGPLAHGFNVALAEYTLAPEASMTQIVGQIGALLDHLAADKDRVGIGAGPLCLAGHSAGGHLTAMYRSHHAVKVAMPISPLVDLEPISLCFLNDNLRLTAQEIAECSPMRRIAPGAPSVVAVGMNELPELVRHSTEYVEACVSAGETALYLPVPGKEHFGVLDELQKADGLMTEALVQAVEALR